MKNTGFAALEAEVFCLATEQEHQGHGGLNFLVGPGQHASPLTVSFQCPCYPCSLLRLPNWNSTFKGAFRKLHLSSGNRAETCPQCGWRTSYSLPGLSLLSSFPMIMSNMRLNFLFHSYYLALASFKWYFLPKLDANCLFSSTAAHFDLCAICV